jgi:hypothetical protein
MDITVKDGSLSVGWAMGRERMCWISEGGTLEGMCFWRGVIGWGRGFEEAMAAWIWYYVPSVLSMMARESVR